MSRIPFDRDAVMLSPNQLQTLFCTAGAMHIKTWFQFFFPKFLHTLDPLERWLASIPLGGQYCSVFRVADINRPLKKSAFFEGGAGLEGF